MALLLTLPPVARASRIWSTPAIIDISFDISFDTGTGAGMVHAIAASIDPASSCAGLAWLQGHCEWEHLQILRT